jgi:hypothetical protein
MWMLVASLLMLSLDGTQLADPVLGNSGPAPGRKFIVARGFVRSSRSYKFIEADFKGNKFDGTGYKVDCVATH